MNSHRRDLRVFEFSEEDELADLASAVQLRKFKNPTLNDHPQLKYDFLPHSSQKNKVRPKNITSVPCDNVDVTESDIDNNDRQPQHGVGEKFNAKESKAEFEDASVPNSTSSPNNIDSRTDDHTCRNTIDMEEKVPAVGVSSRGVMQLQYLSDSPSGDMEVNLNSDDEVSTSESSPLINASEIAEDDASMDDYAATQCFETPNSNEGVATVEVVLYPDYVIYQDNHYIGPELTFSGCCVKIKRLPENGKQGSFIFERAIDDVVDIKCQLYQDVETVIIVLHVISTDVVQLDNALGTSGIEELKIAVVESNWSLKYKQITSLNVKYLALWNDDLEAGMGTESDESPVQRHDFPTYARCRFDEPFDEVIYPKGDPDAVSLSKRDIDLLQPDSFVNDTIIDFYIKYLKNQIPDEDIHRFHFFNSFFFRKLADLDKTPSSAFDGKAAFVRVRKWTRKVDLFEKDYIFIPVNFHLHWSLIVICHLGEVIHSIGEDLDNSSKVPCILQMDSIKGSHSGIKSLLQSYLWEEWKEREKEAREDLSSRFLNMRFISLELPQQENHCDCGLFVLHYLELFLAEAPLNFNPFKTTKFSNFLTADWFPPAEASLKRTLIRRLIIQLLQNRSFEVSSSDHSDYHQSTEYAMNGMSDACVEFHSEGFGSEIKDNRTCSSTGDGVDMLSVASSMDPQSVNSSSMILRDLFDAGATAGSLINTHQSFDHKPSSFHLYPSIIPIAEGQETGEQMDGTAPHLCTCPSGPSTVTFNTSYAPEIVDLNDNETSEETSDCVSDDSEGIRSMQRSPSSDSLGPFEVNRDEDARNFVPKQNMSCLNLAIASMVKGSKDSALRHVSRNEVPPEASRKLSNSSVQDSYSSKDDELIVDHDLTLSSIEEQATKRMRMTPPTNGSNITVILS